ncbi:hypothetical protein [Persephonella sp.]
MKIDEHNIDLTLDSRNINFSFENVSIKVITQNNDQLNEVNISVQRLKLDISKIDLSKGSKTSEELESLLISILIEKITGKKIKVVSLSNLRKSISEIEPVDVPQTGMELDYRKVSYQEDYVKFQAEGYIKTKDGRQVKFALSFEISRSELQVEHLNVKAGNLAVVDPLIINFDGDISDLLSDKYFEFDINSDGKNEHIPLLREGRGFLVFDKNGNGRIDNGSELFGTKTGDGFKELSGYDEDRNSWIDENDSIFSRLGVWIKTPSHDRIYSLKDLGVGAVYLKNLKTYFPYKNGQLSQSGIYLKENLDIGFVSKVDFKV